MAIPEPCRQRDRRCPYARDHHCGGSARWTPCSESRGRSVLGHDLRRDHFHHGQNTERHDYRVAEISQDGDEIRDQVYRRQGISGNAKRQRPRTPRCARVAGGKVDGMHVTLDRARPVFQPVEHRVIVLANRLPEQFEQRHLASGRLVCISRCLYRLRNSCGIGGGFDRHDF